MTSTTDRILDAAESRMRMRGYHAVSFRDLADDLGIKSASVHYHFPQKEDLGLALVARYSERFFAALNGHAAKAKSRPEKIKAFCKTYEEALKSSDKNCLCGMLGAESRGLPDQLKQAVAAFFDANIKWIWQALPADMEAGQRKATAAQIVATLQGAMMLSISLGSPKTFENAAKGLIASHA
ncbi:MAG: TetR/AcrR family transcriptional regulator [Pseudomonadota bacterium]